MPLFAVIARDNPGMLETRQATREAHLEHVRTGTTVQMAGPLIENGEMAGSLLILDCPDMQAARDWAERDPYRAAGLFRSVEVIEWKKVIG